MKRIIAIICIAMCLATSFSFNADAQKRRKGKARTTRTTSKSTATQRTSAGLTFRTFTNRAKEQGKVYQSANERGVTVSNLLSMGFVLVNRVTERRADYTGEEYYDAIIETYSKTVDDKTTTILLEEEYTEITFPNAEDANIFFASAKATGLKKEGNTLIDNPDIYWAGTNVEINGNVVKLFYRWEA